MSATGGLSPHLDVDAFAAITPQNEHERAVVAAALAFDREVEVEEVREEDGVSSEGGQPAKLTAIPFAERFGASLGLGGLQCGCAVICFIIPVLWPIGILFLLGIPVSFLYMAFAAKTHLQGNCPYCGAMNRVSKVAAGFNCKACNQRVIVNSQRFLRVP